MSKLETIKGFSDSPQLKVLQAINQLEREIQQLPAELSSYLADQAAQQIEPILQQFDQVTQSQRAAIQALVDEISLNTTQALQQQLLMLSGKTDNLDKTLQQVTRAAEFMEKAQKPIQQAAWKVHNSAEAIQRQPWKKLLSVAALAAVLASVLVVGGMHGLKLLQQKPATNDMQLQRLLDRATPAETELLLEIYKR